MYCIGLQQFAFCTNCNNSIDFHALCNFISFECEGITEFVCGKLVPLMHFLQVDLRHRQVSKSVEEVQKILKVLTAEISLKDTRFNSITNTGVHNNSFKVTFFFSITVMFI